MQTNNHQLVDYDAVLDAKFGLKGTASRLEAEEKAYAFYTGQIIGDARKKAKITQVELARRIGSNRSYISRVESGQTEPKPQELKLKTEKSWKRTKWYYWKLKRKEIHLY